MSRITRILALVLLASTARAQTCFSSTQELRDAVDAYLDDPSASSTVATTYGYPIGTWCVRYIQDFSDLFANMRNPKAENFNEDLSGWVTVNARDMSFMFAGAHAFDGDVSNFQTGRVKTMQGMFEDASTFNGDLSNWNVFNVKNFSFMFHGAFNFAGDLSQWKTLCAENTSYMFYTAVKFNSDLSQWEVGSITNFRFMFDDAEIFQQNLCPWDAKISRERLSGFLDLNAMFAGTACPNTDNPGFDTTTPTQSFCFDCNTVGTRV
jgi:hypothetical protein